MRTFAISLIVLSVLMCAPIVSTQLNITVERIEGQIFAEPTSLLGGLWRELNTSVALEDVCLSDQDNDVCTSKVQCAGHDYANLERCGQLVDVGELPACVDDVHLEFCAENSWIELRAQNSLASALLGGNAGENGGTEMFTVRESGAAFNFRFVWTQPCKGFVLRAVLHNGGPARLELIGVFVDGNELEVVLPVADNGGRMDEPLLRVCPSHPAFRAFTTYQVTVRAVSGDALVSLTLEEMPLVDAADDDTIGVLTGPVDGDDALPPATVTRAVDECQVLALHIETLSYLPLHRVRAQVYWQDGLLLLPTTLSDSASLVFRACPPPPNDSSTGSNVLVVRVDVTQQIDEEDAGGGGNRPDNTQFFVKVALRVSTMLHRVELRQSWLPLPEARNRLLGSLDIECPVNEETDRSPIDELLAGGTPVIDGTPIRGISFADGGDTFRVVCRAGQLTSCWYFYVTSEQTMYTSGVELVPPLLWSNNVASGLLGRFNATLPASVDDTLRAVVLARVSSLPGADVDASAATAIAIDIERLVNECSFVTPRISPLVRGGDATAPGRSAPLTPAAEPAPDDCSYADWRSVIALLTAIVEGFGAAPLFNDILSVRWQADTLLLCAEVASCDAMVRSMQVSQVGVIELAQSTGCPSGIMGAPADDACCSLGAEWRECCVPRSYNVTGRVIAASNDTVMSGQCADPVCTETWLDELQDVQVLVDFGDLCEAVPLDALDELVWNALDFYRACKVLALGDRDALGVHCAADDECPPQSRCDRTLQRCYGGLALRERQFVECLNASAPPDVVESLRLLYPEHGDDASIAEIIDGSLTKPLCVSSSGGIINALRNRFEFTVDVPRRCLNCPAFLCADTLCDRPLRCGLPDLHACSPPTLRFVEAPPERDCESLLTCNWFREQPPPEARLFDTLDDAGIPAAAVCTPPSLPTHFCGICEFASGACFELGGVASEAECQQSVACVDGRGVVHASVVDSAQCRGEHAACSQPCSIDGEPTSCATRDQCESVGGSCVDSDELWQTLAMVDDEQFGGTLRADGVCLLPLEPYNGAPRCPVRVVASGESYDFTTARGCVAFSNCTLAWRIGSRLPCERTLPAPADCALAGGRWITPLDDAAACTDAGVDYCDEQLLYGLLSAKNASECAECTFAPSVPAWWRAGRWVEGRLVAGVWMARAAVPAYARAPSIEYAELGVAMSLAGVRRGALAMQSDLLCSASLLVAPNTAVVCGCAADGLQSEACYESASSQVGVGIACRDVPTSVEGYPATIWFDPGAVVRDCTDVVLFRVDLEEYIGPPRSDGTSLFVNLDELALCCFQVVRNRHGTVIGQGLGSGVRVEPSEPENVASFALCMFLSRTIELLADRYPAFDLAYWDVDSKRLVPLNISGVELSAQVSNLVCSPRAEPIQMPLLLSPTGEFFPIARVDGLYDELIDDTSVFSDAEIAVLGACSALYFSAALLCFVVLVILWLYRPSMPNLVLVSLFIAMMLMRGVYMALAAAEVLGDAKEDTGDYFLLELPTFLYMSACSVLAMSFLYFWLNRPDVISIDAKKNVSQRTSWAAFGTFNVLLYALFIVVLVLLAVLPGNGSVRSSCGGRVHAVDNDDTARIVRLVYKAAVAAIAITIATVIFSVGLRIYRRLPVGELLILVGTTSVGLVCNCIAFLIYLSINDLTPYFSIAMLVTEALPIAVTVGLICPRNLRRLRRTQRAIGRPKRGSHRQSSRTTSNNNGDVIELSAISTTTSNNQ
jgi:hypothetical protein